PKLIDRSLFNAIRADDVRKKQFVQVGTSGNNLQPRNKFFDPGRKAGGQRTVTTDLVYMRADEFYLLNAEANARIGQETKAKQALTKLLSQRITDLSYLNNLSGKALLDEIYLQTRIELWGEGKSYLAMKRNKATITRGPNHLFLAGEPIPYNDDRLTFVIPQAEVLNNPVLNQ
ncbi:MAG: RagB/SusD family nutrient uptake outer membrane protein, partial [Flavisolibacter sp.]|nr:RagB/SusD family nutrient uptake outer membrane protein [Flavisolibacter sp.]